MTQVFKTPCVFIFIESFISARSFELLSGFLSFRLAGLTWVLPTGQGLAQAPQLLFIWGCLNFSHPVKDSFTGYRILGWQSFFFFFFWTLNQSAQPLTSKASERNLPMVLRVLPDKCSILPGTVYSLPVSQNPRPQVFTNQICHFSARARTSADLMVERLSGNISTLVCWGVDLLKSPTLLLPGADNTQRCIQSLTIHLEKR